SALRARLVMANAFAGGATHAQGKSKRTWWTKPAGNAVSRRRLAVRVALFLGLPTMSALAASMRVRLAPSLAALSILLALRPAARLADISNVGPMFAANDRSIWTDGPGVHIDRTGFLGPDPWNIDKTVGEVKSQCLFGFCASFGAEIGARTSGSAGIGYGLKV